MANVRGSPPSVDTTPILACTSAPDVISATTAAICKICNDAELDVRVALVDTPLRNPVVIQLCDSSGAAPHVVVSASSTGQLLATFEFTLPHRPGHQLTDVPAADLEIVAAAAGSALRCIRLAAQVEHAVEISDVMCDTVRLAGLASNLALHEVLTTIAALAHRVAASEIFAVYAVDESRREVFCVECTVPAYRKALRFAYGDGVAGTVALTGKTIRLDDAQDNTVLSRESGVRDTLCVPVLLQPPAAPHGGTPVALGSGSSIGPRRLAILQVR